MFEMKVAKPSGNSSFDGQPGIEGFAYPCYHHSSPEMELPLVNGNKEIISSFELMFEMQHSYTCYVLHSYIEVLMSYMNKQQKRIFIYYHVCRCMR